MTPRPPARRETGARDISFLSETTSFSDFSDRPFLSNMSVPAKYVSEMAEVRLSYGKCVANSIEKILNDPHRLEGFKRDITETRSLDWLIARENQEIYRLHSQYQAFGDKRTREARAVRNWWVGCVVFDYFYNLLKREAAAPAATVADSDPTPP